MTALPVKDRFELPKGVIYLDGNSLGPLPRGAADRARTVLTEEWGTRLIRAWNDRGWMDLPARVGDRIAGLIGAAPGTVATGDTLSIKVHQALDAALALRPDRRVILSDSGNFPTDLYVADGLTRMRGRGHEVRTPAPEDVACAIDDSVAVLLLTQVDYRTGRLHDIPALTRAAHDAGALVIWDLAHSAGALPVDLSGCGADFAVGCSYKYLNGGPGAPAFIYVRPDLVERIDPGLAGWMGHARPFAMERDYAPAPGSERMRIGTPPVVQLSILDAALDAWDGVVMQDVRRASIRLSELFVTELARLAPSLRLVSPTDPEARGSQVSFAHPHGYEVMQALIEDGVIGDFRPPDLLRFGITPLYLDADDIRHAAVRIARTLDSEVWREPRFARRSRVT